MSRLLVALLLSVVANAVIAVLWWHPATGSAPAPAQLAEPGEPFRPGAEVPAVSETAIRKEARTSARPGRPSGEDLAAVYQELHAAGYPREIIVRVLNRLNGERMNEWFRSAMPRDDDAPYWKMSRQGIVGGSELHQQMIDVRKKFKGELVALVGDDYLDALPEQRLQMQERFGPLSSSKLLLVEDWTEERMQRMSQLHRGGPPTEDAQQRQREIDREMRAELSRFLTAQELLQFEVRNSDTAHQIRRDFAAAKLTESEFLIIFGLMQPLQDQLSPVFAGRPDATALQARTLAQEQLAAALQLSFPERAADFAQARDGSARQENALVARLGLPLSAARDVVTIRDDVQKRARGIVSNETLSAAQRQEQLAVLSNEATQRITATLGERGMSAYRQYGGAWLQRLTTPAPPR